MKVGGDTVLGALLILALLFSSFPAFPASAATRWSISLALLAIHIFSMFNSNAKNSASVEKTELRSPITRYAERILPLKRWMKFLGVKSTVVWVVLQKFEKSRQLPLLGIRQFGRLFPKARMVNNPHAFLKALRCLRNCSDVVNVNFGSSARVRNISSTNSGRYSPSGSRSAIRPMTAERRSLTSCCNVSLLMQKSIPHRAFPSTCGERSRTNRLMIENVSQSFVPTQTL